MRTDRHPILTIPKSADSNNQVHFFFLFYTADTNIWTRSFNIRAGWESRGLFFSDCNCLRRRIHPNVIFLYDALACGVNSPEQSGCICSYVCVRCGPLAPTLVLTNAHPALYFCILCERALPELEQSNNNQDEKDKKKERKKKASTSTDYILNRAGIVLLSVQTFPNQRAR